TQVSPFMLKTGRLPRIMPPLITGSAAEEMEDKEETFPRELIESLNNEVDGAKDCLLAVKISQAHHANKDHGLDPLFKVGNKVMLETAHWRRDYMQKKSG
ncbi:hypothetical protein L208DRAFT_1252770, partial [Tricholoma matsutake]